MRLRNLSVNKPDFEIGFELYRVNRRTRGLLFVAYFFYGLIIPAHSVLGVYAALTLAVLRADAYGKVVDKSLFRAFARNGAVGYADFGKRDITRNFPCVIRVHKRRIVTRVEKRRENREQQMTAQFKNLANDILRQNSADFKAQNEQRLEELLSPLRTNLDEFRKTVTDTYSSEARERFSLTERIRELVELNNTISREARELTLALRGNNQVQGDWGEMVLETILEKSGLQEGEEYFMQVTNDQHGSALRNEAGQKLRPDVVVKYPDGRCVIIDSKVSLTAFIEYANAENEKTQNEASARHLKSMRAHIDELARKNYQDYIGEAKLDFVMMFIPNEPAYIAAMRLDPSLWQEAYDRKVLIVSPTHLVSGLRLIEQLWSRDKVTKNAIKIAEDAGKMYDKFADFTKDMDRISSAIANASKAHADAMTKLSTGTGNLVKRAQDLKALGIKAAKQLSASVEQG